MNFVQQLVDIVLEKHIWILYVFVVVIAILLVDFIYRKIIKRLITHAELKTENIWDDAVLHAIKKPISFILWMVGLTFISNLIEDKVGEQTVEVISTITHVGIIIAIAWFVTGVIRYAQNKLIQQQQEKPECEERIDSVTIEALCKLLRLAIIITTGIVVLETLGFSISGILAFGGIGGIAIGFAAKDLLSNFFGGLMIYLDRPFAVGDWIRSNDREIEGTVEHIGWRQTRIRTFAKRPIYVPNSVFANIVVENPSRMTHRRIHETIGIRYDDVSKVELIVADVKAMLQDHPDIDTSQALIVNFNAFSASSIDFFIYTMTKTINWFKYHDIKQDVLLKVSHIIESHGAEFAFPTTTLHVNNETPELAGIEPDISK